MKILLNGACGRMGRTVRAMLAGGGKDGASLAGAVDANANEDGVLRSLEEFTGEADCLLDFSNHAATEALCAFACSRGLPLIVATTGQTGEELARLHAAAEKIPVFLSGNMSLGIAVLCRMARTLAAAFPDADIEIVESHHNQKLDVPSGTALMLAHAIQAARPGSTLLVGRHEDGKREKREIGIHSLRMGNTVGIHEVIVNTGSQILTLRHEAQDRSLFAEGALAAAAFLAGQKPGLYGMEELTARLG